MDQDSPGNPLNPGPTLTGLRPVTEDWSIDPPEAHLDDSDEKRKKSISRSKQWKEFVTYARQRQEAYRMYIPGFNPSLTKSDDNWRVADCIVREIEGLINFIEGDNGKKT